MGVQVLGSEAVLVEVNSETDFVARSAIFQARARPPPPRIPTRARLHEPGLPSVSVPTSGASQDLVRSVASAALQGPSGVPAGRCAGGCDPQPAHATLLSRSAAPWGARRTASAAHTRAAADAHVSLSPSPVGVLAQGAL